MLHAQMLNKSNSISNDQQAGTKSVGKQFASQRVSVPRNPLTYKATAMGVWIFYTLFVVLAFAVEKIGTRKKTTAQ